MHAGTVYVAAWIAPLLDLLFHWLFPPTVANGEWGLFLLVLKGEIPVILVWCFCAALVASITEVQHPLRWALVLAIFLVLSRVTGWELNEGATIQDRVAFIVLPSLFSGALVIWTYMVTFRRIRVHHSLSGR